MKWKDLSIVAFDTETTGLDPYGGDRVIEVALVVFQLGADGRVAEQTSFSRFCNPGMPIPRKVTEITGIRDEDVAGQPPFAEIAPEIAERFRGALTVAHNYPFDLAFLSREFDLAGLPWREPLAAIDTVDVSMKHFPDARSHKLGDVARRLDVVLDGAHRAANDAEACGRCFIELARRHQVADDLQALLDWADAIGRPPEDGPLEVDIYGVPVFADGPHKGEFVAEHPIHLAWMEKARVRRAHGWDYLYPESTRRWVRRFLDVRAAGRARQQPKSFRATDWVIDPCITRSRLTSA
ncbi:MAG: 3'-5' exonuclease [Alphaproteobacteria bacterium]|nr:3'-5' exonuclease [Alphaproteobacteria bacterium]